MLFLFNTILLSLLLKYIPFPKKTSCVDLEARKASKQGPSETSILSLKMEWVARAVPDTRAQKRDLVSFVKEILNFVKS